MKQNYVTVTLRWPIFVPKIINATTLQSRLDQDFFAQSVYYKSVYYKLYHNGTYKLLIL